MAAPTPLGSVQPYSSGPTYVYLGLGAGNVAQQGITGGNGVGNGNQGAAVFFGTAEGYPKHERRVDTVQLMNDVGGRKKPIDVGFQGMDATLSLTMTIWDEGVAQILENLPRFNASSGQPGSWNFADMGALMAFEGFAFQVWLAYNFGAKAAYNELPLGYHYFLALPMTIGDESGGAPMKRIFSFYIWPKTNFATKMQTLFDYNVNNLPAIVGPNVV